MSVRVIGEENREQYGGQCTSNRHKGQICGTNSRREQCYWGVNQRRFGSYFVSLFQERLDEFVLEHFRDLVCEELLGIVDKVMLDTLRVTFVQFGFVRDGFLS